MRTRLFLLLLLFGFAAAGIGAADDGVRIESEYKLTVPNDRRGEVWSYLEKRYENGEDLFLKDFDPSFRTEMSRELFVDVYFDTPALDLLERASGVRRRDRSFPDDPSHKKHGRSLVQIKLDRPADSALNRSEIKFKVRKDLEVGEGNEGGPGSLIRKPSEREEFEARIRELGLDPESLREILTIRQTRRRAYISNSEGPFATITFDEVTAEAGGRKVDFTEVELELNEIRYTDADGTTRSTMEKVNDLLRRDLQDAFEFIEVDQTPKYNKAARALGIAPQD